MDRPRYSVIIPFFNAERFLAECLDSVIAQTFGDWECICVDDGSGDQGRHIVEEYASKDSRIRYVSQAHLGVGAARNLGISLAKGKYLVFVDADDCLLPDAFQSLCGETADIVTFLNVPGNDAIDGGMFSKRNFEIASISNSEFARLFNALGGNLLAWNAVYLRERIGDVKFPNLVNCEDLVYCAEAISKARTITTGLPCWYVHRVVEGSAANSHSCRRTLDSLKSISLMFGEYRKCVRGCQMWYILMRKLTMHFILHVLAEVPKSFFSCRD